MRFTHWSRRRWLAGAGALPFAGMLRPFDVRAAEAPLRPPVARIEPVEEKLWGETIVDPYRWMETPSDAEWAPFMKGQAAYSRAILDAIPGREKLRERIAQLSADAATTRRVQAASGRIFYEKRPQGADNFKLYVRVGLAGADKTLVDPTELGQDGRHVSLDWWRASPNGRFVVYGLSPAGSENSVAHILDVDTGEVLPERIDRAQYAGPEWLPDSSGFFLHRLAEGARLGAVDYYRNSVAWLHRLRTDPKDDLEVLASGQYGDVPVDPVELPFALTDPTSEHVVVAPFGGVRHENAFYTARLDDVIAGRPRWRKVCDIADEVVRIAFAGDALYLLTTRDAPNGRILRTSLSAPDLARAEVIVAETSRVIERIHVARDALYVQEMDGGYGGLRRVTADSRSTPVALPYEGSIAGLATDAREDGAWFLGTGWLLPVTVFRYEPASGRCSDTGLSPKPPIDLAPYRAIRSFATARDGTRVPLSIVVRKDAARNGRNPTLVGAYGSYQIVNGPRFDPRRIAFLEQGGVLATAHVRGGGEYGKRWWKAGQKLDKPTTWRDLIDCCEALIRMGWTQRRHLAIQGGSAGGITVGRALTERPDLFAAVISDVGVSNALRAEFSQNGPPNIDEFGTITDRDGFIGLRQMDALHAVRDGTKYPAVLLTTGMTDPRVEPWQAAKMAARLQKASSSGNPVLLRVTFDAGHGLGSTRTQQDEQVADAYAFVLWRAARKGFQPPA
jgi:prolyl oligopeptidase